MHYAPWTFCILTFGCKVNQYESQSVREAWQRMDGAETDAPAEADVILLNTCAVTANAVTDARQAVRRLQREAPGVPVVIAGCAAEVARKQLAALPGVLRVVEQDHKSRLLDAPPLVLFAEEAAGSATPFPSSPAEAAARAATRDRTFPPFHIDGFRRARPVLKVQDGCSHGCAYCIVPLTRGPARSRPPKDCLAEMRRLLEAGYREIMISGINLRQYAMRDEGCRDFWDLLSYLDRELAPEWGSGARADPARFRISSVEPAQLTERGIATLAETRMVCPHLHLSLAGCGADDVPGLLSLFALEGLAERHPQSLSGGEKQRLVIACAFAKRPDVLILDEPTSGLDGRNMRRIADALDLLAGRGACVLVITHDLELMGLSCARALRLPLS